MAIDRTTGAPAINGLPGIQILRAVAALFVVVHHTLKESRYLFDDHIPPQIVVFGASGVDLFFVISGFIMYYTNCDNFGRNAAPINFFVRRIIRIAPLYWLCTVTIVLLHIGGLYQHLKITGLSLVLSLLFLPNANIVLGFGWTLNYEMYFYAILAMWLLSRTTRTGVAGVVCSIPLMMALGWCLPHSSLRDFLTNPISLEFCFGVAVAVAFTGGYISVRIVRFVLLIGIVGLVIGTLGPRAGDDPGSTAGLAPQVRFIFWGLPAVALLVSALFVQQIHTRVGKFVLALGDASYSLYLTHTFVMIGYARVLKMHALPGMPRPVWMLIPVLVSIAVGLTTYRLIEQPMNVWLKVGWKRRSDSTSALELVPEIRTGG